MALAVTVRGGHEDLLIDQVASESDRRNAETREGVLEPVASREGASVSPSLTV